MFTPIHRHEANSTIKNMPAAPFGAQPVDSPEALRVAHRNALLRLAAADLTGMSDVDTTMRHLAALGFAPDGESRIMALAAGESGAGRGGSA